MTSRAWTATTALLTISLCACSGANITKGETSTGSESGGETDEDGTTEDSGFNDNPPAEDQPCAIGDPIMEMGTGEEEFLEIADGDEIEVIHGTQDGHHILGSLRTQNTAEIVADFKSFPCPTVLPSPTKPTASFRCPTRAESHAPGQLSECTLTWAASTPDPLPFWTIL